MPLKLAGPSTHEEGEKFTMTKGQTFSSNRINVKKGKYYYEVTHYNGTNTILVGFSTNLGRVQFYSQGSLSNLVVWLNDDFLKEFDTNLFGIPWDISSDEYTVGLGIDIDAGYFYIFYETNYFSFKYSPIPKGTPFNIVVREAVPEGSTDTVSVNFGSTPFKYNHTTFTKWTNKIKAMTCKTNKYRMNSMLLFMVYLVTK